MLGGIRYTIRALRQRPGFTAAAVITLGLGIAANATVFGWIDTVLLRPIPGVIASQELVALEAIGPNGERLSTFQHPDFRDFQRGLTQASGVTASHFRFFTVGPADQARRVMGQVVAANFFAVLGVKPYLGRMFSVEEDRDEQGAYPIAVISHRLWRSYFRADFGVVGRTVRVNGRQLAVVGVAPPEFRGTFGGAALDIWVPLSMIVQLGSLNTWAASDRNARFLNVLARLKPGVGIEQARAEVRAVAARIAAAYPDTHRGVGASLVPIWRASYGLQATLLDPLRMLMVVCVLVLLIACANVANLLMARSVTRHREFGIRIALGAGRGTLARQLLSEVLVLAGLGAALGVLLAQWFGDSLEYVVPALDVPVRAAIEPLLHPKPNASVLAFTAAVSIAAAVLSTILPALAVRRVDVNETLKEGGRTGTPGARSHRARGGLVVGEVALAAIALVGAGLAVRGFQKLSTMNPGFEPKNVLLAHFHLSTNGYSLEQEKQFCRNLRLRLEATPGLEQVGYADSVPLSVFPPSPERVEVEGSDTDRNGVVSLPRSIVAPGYFDLMRIPLVAGRDFTEQDDRKAPAVIIVNETFARRYFPGRDPIGRKVRISGNLSTIVGVARDSKYHNPPEGPTAFFYGPFRQIFFSGHNNFFYIRTKSDLGAARAALRREAAALGVGGGLYETSSLEEYTQAGLFGERIAASLLSVLGLLSLALAAIGLYSVMAYSVNERTQEIGIRMALGAQRWQVLRMVLRKGLGMTLAGLAAGITAAVAGARAASSILNVPVSVNDPVVLCAAAAFLIAVALMACYLPARRATRIDPVEALRSE
jgi:predicted permease